MSRKASKRWGLETPCGTLIVISRPLRLKCTLKFWNLLQPAEEGGGSCHAAQACRQPRHLGSARWSFLALAMCFRSTRLRLTTGKRRGQVVARGLADDHMSG